MCNHIKTTYYLKGGQTMLQDQINALTQKEEELTSIIKEAEELLAKTKKELQIIKRAKVNLISCQEQLNGQTTVSTQ
jgi:hypothetical protein